MQLQKDSLGTRCVVLALGKAHSVLPVDLDPVDAARSLVLGFLVPMVEDWKLSLPDSCFLSGCAFPVACRSPTKLFMHTELAPRSVSCSCLR